MSQERIRHEARPDKVAAVAEIQGHLSSSEVIVVSEYRGLSVAELQELRRSLRAAGGKYKIYKNTLARRAAEAAELDSEFSELLLGPTALTYAETPADGPVDVVGIAKALKDFGSDHDELVIKGGLFEGRYIDAGEVNRLADIEPREVLLSKFAGLMAAPMQQLAGLLEALPRNFAYGLKALIDQGGAPGAPAPADDPIEPATDPAPDDAAEEAPTSDEADAPEPAPEPAASSAPENEESE